MDIKELCFKLADFNGTSGDEKEIANFLKCELERYFTDVNIDVLGNVIANNNCEGKRVLLVAHMDSIGLVVRGIDDKGFILVDKVGGADVRVLTGAEVVVHGEKDLFGVICSTPPHLLTDSERKSGADITKMAVDIGCSKEETEKYVAVGDRITFRCNQKELLNGNISSCYFDDRACAAAILLVLEKIKDKIEKTALSVQFSVQEEVGLVGAKTGAFSVRPDRAIVVDVGFGDDPYTNKSSTITLGKGPSIGISPILDRCFTKELVDLCESNGIPYQHDVMNRGTGTDADSITVSGCGVKTALLSLPLRYMHTGNEVINVSDVEYTAELISEYLLKKEVELND